MRFTDDSHVTRRRVLGAAAALSFAGFGVTGVRGFADRHDDDTLARAIDANFDRRRDLRLRWSPDPSDETPRRGQVLHATSDGNDTLDYAVTLSVTEEDDLTLGDLAADEQLESRDHEDARFAYDFYTGEQETGPSPDEVWLVLRSESDTHDFRAIFRTEDVAAAGDGWQTRNVARELEGSVPEAGLGQVWKQFDFDDLTWTEATENPVGEFGADKAVLAVGVGRGTPTVEETTADTYYDNLVVAGERRELAPTEERGEGRS